MKTIDVCDLKINSIIEQSDFHFVKNLESNNVLNSNSLPISFSKIIESELVNTVIGQKEIFKAENSIDNKIEFITFDNQFKVINFDLDLNNDLVFNIPNNKDSLYFIYILEGSCDHSFNDDEKPLKVDELRTVSFASGNNNQLIIKGDIPFKCNIIKVSKDLFLKNFVFTDKDILKKLSTILKILEDYVLTSFSSLGIAQELRIINTISVADSLTPYLQLKSRYQLILSQHINQLYAKLFNEEKSHNLSRADVQKIRKITNHIVENPGFNHSQEILCSQFFLSQSKLQAGFKAVNKTTVSNFTRQVRLKKSEELLLNSDFNVSEIVYTVGFTSRSYFSKIFKLEFGCNPSAYRSKLCQKESS